VCCESSCNGPCMACRAGTGRCDVLPADDAACPSVACNSPPQCLGPSSITTNRCAAIGQCKDTSNCTYTTPSAAQTACDTATSDYRICDGRGNCVDPTVSCGASSCPVGADTACCFTIDAAGNPARTCTAAANCIATGGFGVPDTSTRSPVRCDSSTDCRQGQLCCMQDAGPVSVACLPEARCVGSPVSTAGLLCNAIGFSAPCTHAGATCSITFPSLSGLLFCSN
jgi:hypothetical protein